MRTAADKENVDENGDRNSVKKSSKKKDYSFLDEGRINPMFISASRAVLASQ